MKLYRLERAITRGVTHIFGCGESTGARVPMHLCRGVKRCGKSGPPGRGLSSGPTAVDAGRTPVHGRAGAP